MTTQFMLFYFVYVADPATFLASNSVVGPYFPLRAARLLTDGTKFVLLPH